MEVPEILSPEPSTSWENEQDGEYAKQIGTSGQGDSGDIMKTTKKPPQVTNLL
jgi:hypothetical protein